MKSFFIGNKGNFLPAVQGCVGVWASLSQLTLAVAKGDEVGAVSCAESKVLLMQASTNYLKNSILGLKGKLRKFCDTQQ